jgi:peptidoglycan hydrolase-like protein with peptidoglycan-binding domain
MVSLQVSQKIGVAVVTTVLIAAPFITSAATLTRQLQLGMSGADVSALQTFLAMDSSIYPSGIVTGYFGILTRNAVAAFQLKNGLPSVGRVGPSTLPVINAQMGGMPMGTTGGAVISAPLINASRTGATIAFNTNENATSVIYYSTSPLITSEFENGVNSSGSQAMTDTTARTAHSVTLSNLTANTVYHYMVHTTDASGLVSVTWPKTFQTTN